MTRRVQEAYFSAFGYEKGFSLDARPWGFCKRDILTCFFQPHKRQRLLQSEKL